MAATVWLGQVKARSRELHIGPHTGGRGSSIWTILYCLSQAMSRKVDKKWSSWDKNWSPYAMATSQIVVLLALVSIFLDTGTMSRICSFWVHRHGRVSFVQIASHCVVCSHSQLCHLCYHLARNNTWHRTHTHAQTQQGRDSYSSLQLSVLAPSMWFIP